MQIELNDFQLRLVVKALLAYKLNLECDQDSILSNNTQSEDCLSVSPIGNSSINLLKSTINEVDQIVRILSN